MTDQPTSAASLREKARPLIINPATGNTYRVRRPTLASLIKAKVMPENFFAKSMERVAKKDFGESGLTDEDLLRSDEVTRMIVTLCLLSPRVVDEVKDGDDDAVEYEDIPPEDRNFIHAWYRGALEASTVETQSGEVAQSELDTFSPVEQSSQPARTSEDRAGA